MLDFNRCSRIYVSGHNISLNPPNLTSLDGVLFGRVENGSASSVRQYTTWWTRQISPNVTRPNPLIGLARYDSISKEFIRNAHQPFSFTVENDSSQLTLIHADDETLLSTEISVHIESGLSVGDDIVRDVYRLGRLSPASRMFAPSLNDASLSLFRSRSRLHKKCNDRLRRISEHHVQHRVRLLEVRRMGYSSAECESHSLPARR